LNVETGQFPEQFFETLMFPKSWKPLVRHLAEVSRRGNAMVTWT
jgi:hypothetical protein